MSFDRFDVLATTNHGDITGRPLTDRRRLLEELLAEQDTPDAVVVLGMQTDDRDVADVWLDALGRVGVEGVVAKRANGPYRPDVRGWSKVKNYATTEAIIGGVTGRLDRPESLIIGRVHRDDRQLHIAGKTTELPPSAAAEVADALTAADGDHPWPAVLPPSWHDKDPRPYHRVQPTGVVEVRVDVATSHAVGGAGQWRHRLRFLRFRPDLTAEDVPLDLDLEAES